MVETNQTITGLQEVQAALNQIIAELQPRGARGRAVLFVTSGLHHYATAITHVDSGALRAAHRYTVNLGNDPRGVVYIDPSARNPKTGKRPADYGPGEEARGGSHAFYTRTVNERGDALLQQADAIIQGALPRGRR